MSVPKMAWSVRGAHTHHVAYHARLEDLVDEVRVSLGGDGRMWVIGRLRLHGDVVCWEGVRPVDSNMLAQLTEDGSQQRQRCPDVHVYDGIAVRCVSSHHTGLAQSTFVAS